MAETTGYAAAIDTGDILMSYVAEAAWGVTPTTPTFKMIRLDAEGFTSQKSRTRPAEIDAEGQASQAITTKQEAPGSLNFSVSAGTHNDLLASSLGSEFGAAISSTAATYACVADGITGTGIDALGLVAGQFIKVSGFTGDPLNNRIYQITSIETGKLVTNPAPAAADAAGESVTIKGQMVRNGKQFNSFSFQKQLAAALFLQYPGCWPTVGLLDVVVGDYLKGTLAFLNKDEINATSTLSTGGTPTPAPTGTVVDSINGVKNVLWDGALLDAVVQKIGVKWNKEGARAQYGLGSAAAQGMGKGKVTVNGTLSTYFKDFTMYLRYKDEVGKSLSFQALDGPADVATTKGYVITICKATVMNPKIVAGGPNQDVMAEFELEGNPGDTTLYGGKTIQIDYFG